MKDLSIDGLTVRYGHPKRGSVAVDDVQLTVPAGQAVGLVGESGCGKSTLARAVVGLLAPSAGRVLLDGRAGPWPGRSPIQLVFQNPYASLDPRMTVGATIAEALRHRSRRQGRVLVAEHLELVGLEPGQAEHHPYQLSGGQRQRVALARALAAEPDVLLADEITSALDVSVQAAILNLVADLRTRLGLTLLFISHNLAAVRYLCDSIAIMRAGRIVERGPTVELTTAPTDPYTRTLLDAVPRLPRPASKEPGQ